MNENDITRFLQIAVDGQTIRVTTASGRNFHGIYDAGQTTREDGLYFETTEGRELRADWENVSDIEYRNPKSVAGGSGFVVPPEHPLSGVNPVTKRPYTTRNR